MTYNVFGGTLNPTLYYHLFHFHAIYGNNSWQVVHIQCASVTKRYNLILAKGGDALQLKGNCGPGRK